MGRNGSALADHGVPYGVWVWAAPATLALAERSDGDVVGRVIDLSGGRTLDYAAIGGHEREVVHGCRSERNPVHEHPEVIGELRIACRHVPVTQLSVAQRTEEPISDGRLPFAEGPDVVDRVGLDPFRVVGDGRVDGEIDAHGTMVAHEIGRRRVA